MRVALVLGAGATLAHQRRPPPARQDPLRANQRTMPFGSKVACVGIPVDASLRIYAGNLLGTDPFEPGEGKLGMESFFKR